MLPFILHQWIEGGTLEASLRLNKCVNNKETATVECACEVRARIWLWAPLLRRQRLVCRRAPAAEALGGYAEVQPMVFCGLFPTEADRFPDLREALGKLQLNDAALVYEPEVRSLLLTVYGSGHPAWLEALLCEIPNRCLRLVSYGRRGCKHPFNAGQSCKRRGTVQVTESVHTPLLSHLVKVHLMFCHAQVSSAMGFGFRCGFLGLLHMEIVQERLEREYSLDLIITAPTVVYRCTDSDGSELTIDNPCELPDHHSDLREPYVRWAPCLRNPAGPGRQPASGPCNLTCLVGRVCHEALQGLFSRAP